MKFMLNYRLATIDDLEEVNGIFQSSINEMEMNKIFQWDEIYPDKKILKNDIEKKQLYICLMEENIVSAYVINKDYDKEYNYGNWQYPESSFLVIHRLCVNPKFQNRGIGTLTMKHIEKELKNKGIETIRLDAFIQNPYAVKMYEKLGYRKAGLQIGERVCFT